MLSSMVNLSVGLLLANERYKWFYWISFILAASFFLVVAGLAVGYARKVLLPKYRGRRIEE